MGRPRKHPRRWYRPLTTGFYSDQQTGEQFGYHRGVLIPEGRLARALVNAGLAEPADEDLPAEIERVSSEPTSIEK